MFQILCWYFKFQEYNKLEQFDQLLVIFLSYSITQSSNRCLLKRILFRDLFANAKQDSRNKNAFKVFDNACPHLRTPIDLIADLVMDLRRLSHEILNYYSTLGFNKLDWWIDASSQWKSLISSLFHVKNFLSPFHLMHVKRFTLKTRRICQA